MAALVAHRHEVRLKPALHVHVMENAWNWLHQAASSSGHILLTGGGGGSSVAHFGVSTDLRIVAGANTWLRGFYRRVGRPPSCVPVRAGDWEVSDIFTRWPPQIAVELAGFVWPFTSSSEVVALVSCEHASPSALMAFEFTAALRAAHEHHWRYQKVALSVNLRSSLVPGPHASVDARFIMWGLKCSKKPSFTPLEPIRC